jgi:hypothetical protein
LKIAAVTIAPGATEGVFAALGISAALGTLSLQDVPNDCSVSKANATPGVAPLFAVASGSFATDTSEVYLVNNGENSVTIVARYVA